MQIQRGQTKGNVSFMYYRMYHRRDALKFGLAAGSYLGLAQGLMAQTVPADAPLQTAPAFEFLRVIEQARLLASKPYKAPDTSLPNVFSNLNYEQYVGIRPKPNSAIWANDGLGLAIEPLHRGFIFSAPMDIFTVENGLSQRVAYDPARFDFDKIDIGKDIKDIGYSGFRILESRDGGGFNERVIFQGASFFRAVAKDQNIGVMARALAVRTGDPSGEEFAIIRAVWIERPGPATRQIVVHALLDSESVTGAFRFTIRIADATIIDTEATLVPRVTIDHIGVAAMQVTSYFSPLDKRKTDDLRPAVYEATGLQMLTGHGEWLWRPVSNRQTLQGSAFIDENPRGFGLIQRDRDSAAFEDDVQHWERRPTLWIEPIQDWGPGQFELLEIPSDSEVNQNVYVYWRPKDGLKPGTEASFAYRQFWCWSPPVKPPLAMATTTRSGKVTVAGKPMRRCIVDFVGDNLAEDVRPQPITTALTLTGAQLVATRILPGKTSKTVRVQFDFEPGGENLVEMRLVLLADGKPLSETWVYRWTA